MARPTSVQIRAGRAMLDWSMLALSAAAHVSVSTVKRFEHDDGPSVSDSTVALMQGALETEGVQFLVDDGNGPGVRLQRR